MEKFYITTAIYYVNSKPHIGSVSEAIAADVIARYKRLSNFDVFFSTGTDEHSQKIEAKAKELGIDPQRFVDEAASLWRNIFDKFNISYSRFIRTSDSDHMEVVKDFFTKMYENGDIYLSTYEGWYCVRDETFLKDSELVDGKCPHCGGEVQKLSEDNYFFRLSKYRDALLNFYLENPQFVEPESRYNELLNILKSGLQDISVSRKSFKFGIHVPFDEDHTIYVWYDALINYVSAVGYLTDKDKFNKYWPADLHLIGKDITRFHGIVWPAMLMSVGLPLPKKIFAHGFWNLEGMKMSKSLGNVVDPIDFVENFSKLSNISFEKSVDVLRYYLSREAIFGLDGDFRMESFFRRYNSDLANDYGNLINRTLNMLAKYKNLEVPSYSVDPEFVAFSKEKFASFEESFEKYGLSFALDRVFEIISYLNNYIQVKEPWKHTNDINTLNTVLSTLLEGIAYATILLQPFMPNVTKFVLDEFGVERRNISEYNGKLVKKNVLKLFEPIFPRLEKETIELEKKGETKEENVVIVSKIKYEDFTKLDLRVAKILSARRVKNSDKLIELRVSLGSEERTIVAGIGKFYSEEELVGKKIVIIANLEERKLMGITSQGMLLAASTPNKENLSLLIVDKDIEEGAKIS
ncbi:methionine--tRNA ligase [Caldisericum exile]|uniref:Methionine--tRNA ligase n=1 Tax=Caldisericum exile (strain DSM 21853 / NBRC 104410 / AZM16c01) TaxID=511051 RepID=A0A7U6GEZ0_CALEA|nr:methionine--tRNA ligase [Caldisericum exile]BAL81087.1 methionyl-tRNA synthetase [Caldisericum exile AZM16c01]